MNDQIYYSNDGRGPYIARVVSIENGIVWLEIKPNINSKKWKSITISEKFFRSKKCGWKARS